MRKVRAERAEKAAQTRWENKAKRDGIPVALYRGTLKIGDIEISCAVSEDDSRIISENSIQDNLGSSGGQIRKIRAEMEKNTGAPIPLFLASKPLEPFIHKVFSGGHPAPIEYINNNQINRGYDASILPKVCEKTKDGQFKERYDATILPIVCDVYLKARE